MQSASDTITAPELGCWHFSPWQYGGLTSAVHGPQSSNAKPLTPKLQLLLKPFRLPPVLSTTDTSLGPQAVHSRHGKRLL